jgi:ATP-binding cassette subfamily F protein 3
MLVSHDRALLREVCDEFWLVSGGKLEPFDGDLDDYQRWLLDNAREQAQALREQSSSDVPAPAASAGGTPGNRRDERKAAAQARQKLAEQAKPLKTELASVEKRLSAASAERDELFAALADPKLPPAQQAEHGKRLKQLAGLIDELEGRWLELGEAIEALSQG